MGFVCDEHASKPGKFVDKDPTSFLSKYIKLGFPSKEGPIEHMWVLVKKYNEKTKEFEGTLNNDPVLDVGYQCDDDLAFTIEEIEAVEEA